MSVEVRVRIRVRARVRVGVWARRTVKPTVRRRLWVGIRVRARARRWSACPSKLGLGSG